MTPAIDPRAQSGFAEAASYDKHRPSYPPAAVSALLEHLNIAGKQGAHIVELGAGTGKFTELLAAREESYEIAAVEPQENMRAELESKRLPGVKVLQGDAASVEVEEGWADACIAAQAFHWFATHETLASIHKILRPGGTLGLLWNTDYYNSPESWPAFTTAAGEQTLKEINAVLEDGHPRFRHMKWKEVFDQPPSLFSLPLNEDDVKWTRLSTDEALWARFATSSHIVNLPSEKKEEVKTKVLNAIKGDGIDRNEKGEIVLHGLTYFVWTSAI